MFSYAILPIEFFRFVFRQQFDVSRKRNILDLDSSVFTIPSGYTCHARTNNKSKYRQMRFFLHFKNSLIIHNPIDLSNGR